MLMQQAVHSMGYVVAVLLMYRVKSGNFGHQVNSDKRLPSHQDFHCLLLIVNLFFLFQ